MYCCQIVPRNINLLLCSCYSLCSYYSKIHLASEQRRCYEGGVGVARVPGRRVAAPLQVVTGRCAGKASVRTSPRRRPAVSEVPG